MHSTFRKSLKINLFSLGKVSLTFIVVLFTLPWSKTIQEVVYLCKNLKVKRKHFILSIRTIFSVPQGLYLYSGPCGFFPSLKPMAQCIGSRQVKLFTNSVIESPCPSVCMCLCMCVTKVVIVDNGKSIKIF